uniref:ATP synthase complex subunit 8 n=1 Tax=Carbula sinica TaxID=286704 RepID=A0A343W8Y1_9HEMI|nr:ATP synthase F0 subunit 8 [Carbula sinica]AVZ00821.1 ATP synthase F0 subunit 8 [Carbula sinica]
MPQMAPLWWEMLFIMFILTFILMNIMIYFNMKISQKFYKNNYNSIKQFNWKW